MHSSPGPAPALSLHCHAYAPLRPALLALWLFFWLVPTALAQSSEHLGQVMVRVRDRSTEDSLTQARVQLIRFPDGIVSEQFTASDGGVQFSGISVGAYTIRVSRQGYESGEARVDFRRGDASLQTVDILLSAVKEDRAVAPGGTVSAGDLRIPDNARKEFERGMRLLNEKKRPSDSIAAFQRAIDLYPNYPDAYFLMATAQIQTNAAPAAEASLRKAISLNPRTTLPYYPLAMLLFSQRRYGEEQKLLEQAQSLDNTDWRWPFELARCEAQENHWEPAVRHALESSKLPNAATKVHLLLGDIYSNTGRTRDAIEELELFVKLDPESPYVTRIKKVLPELRAQLASDTSAKPQ